MSLNEQKTILLVEDEVITAMMEKKILENHGYKVIIASTGEKAVEIICNSQNIDLVLMDINLGNGIDGTQAAQIILEKYDIPLIFLSSHTEEEVVEKTEGITSYGYIVKNCGEMVLIASIKMAFKLFEAKLNEKLKEKSLEEEKNRTFKILSGIANTFYSLDTNWKFTVVNPAAEKAPFGRPASQLLGKVIWDLYPNLLGTHIHKHYLDAAKKHTLEHYEAQSPLNGRWYEVFMQGWVGGVDVYMRDITEQKQIEETLKNEKSLLNNLMETSPIGITIVDTSGKITYANSRAEKILGLTREKISLKSYNEPSWKITDFNGNPFPDEKLPFPIVMSTKKSVFDIQHTIECPDGERKFLSINASPLFDNNGKINGMIAAIDDITERKIAEEKIKNSEARLRAVLDATPFPVAIVDAEDNNIVYWSRSADILFGHTAPTASEWYQIAYPDLDYRQDVINRWKPFLDIAQKTGDTINTGEYHITCRDKSVRICELYASFVKDNLIVTFNDITERKHAEEIIKQQLKEKETILKEVHHRVKNNITIIENLLKLQLSSISNEEACKILQDTIARTESMRSIYDKLLVTDNYQEISTKSYLDDLIYAITDIFSQNNNINIKKEIDDFQMSLKTIFPLGTIVNELITNSIKYAFTGKDKGEIKIALLKKDDNISLIVHDDGIGFPENFDIDKSGRLGIMLIKSFVQQLNGTLSIENDNGTKCTVNFKM